MAKLIFTDKRHAGQAYELALEKTTVGRSDQNTLVIADPSLSAVHCEILMNGPEVIIRDLGSRNGTFVNGAKLTNQQAQLKAGQIVRFGSVEARLELEGAIPDETVSEITAVYAMGRIMAEQRRQRAHPKPTDPSMKIESSEPISGEDGTVFSAATIPSRDEAGTGASAPARSQPDGSSKKTIIGIVAALIALALFVFLWRWFTAP